MVFVMAITVWALILQVRTAFAAVRTEGLALNATTMNGVVGLALIGLAVSLMIESAKALKNGPAAEPAPGPGAVTR